VQITQNTFNFNTNPSLTNVPQQQQQQVSSNETTRVLNQTIGSQTNVNVILNQTVIQQQQPTVQTTTSTTNQQQMVAININGNQTLIPLSMFTKLLQQKYSSTQQSTTVRV
jgi:short-subunit dehydrogenase involved in D-alanine esterification of teichoic acids